MPWIPAHFDDPDPRMRFDNPNLHFDSGLWVPEENPVDDAQIKVGTDGMSDAEVVAYAKAVDVAMNDPANAALFAGMEPSAVNFATLITNADTDVKDVPLKKKAWTNATTKKNQSVDKLLKGINTRAQFVGMKANGDPVIMGKGNFGSRAAATAPTVAAPTNLSLSYADVPQAIEAHWNRPPGAVSFVGRLRRANQNPPAPWNEQYKGTDSSCVFTDLESGAIYEVEICAVFGGQATPGPACNIMEHRAS